ncbi:ComEA family DNA-binding protein [Cellulomonas marina]|uniref:Competence protein ComEA n=1 Tax=Cellulomonas marina TaxID=988821 RepID=A0A1I0YRD7_9CELL|nr:helix-hairpin-helix domain-containing protein [Cellulomonas marina]GIG27554.1 hypothetical protein Cma02nite_01540 [Cellulomonas marina]SFB15884.1 competence protein ComEA [Cellulomonas marina]
MPSPDAPRPSGGPPADRLAALLAERRGTLGASASGAERTGERTGEVRAPSSGPSRAAGVSSEGPAGIPAPGDDPPRRAARRPAAERGPLVRWHVTPRAAAAAAVAVLLVAGAVVLRLTGLRVGEPVAFPEPQPAVVAVDGSPGGGAGGTDASVAPTAAGTSDGGGVPTGAPTVGTTGSAPAPLATAAATVVHVVGQVAVPGLVRLPDGSRVADAVAAAGGALPTADLAALNLARVLVDGEQVVVPRPGEATPPASAPTGGGASTGDAATGSATTGGTGGDGPGAGPLDLGTATLAQLDALPGIGPVLAQRILDHRATTPFTAVAQLGDVEGIGPTLLERLEPLVTVRS